MKFSTLKKIIKSLVFVLLLSCVFSVLLTYFDHTHWNGIDETEEEQTIFHKVFNRLYFVTSTMSSVGYGDITPKTNIAKGVVILLQLLVLIGFIAIYQSKIIGL